ncbi:MAG TPA: MOSC domain-containing protein [Bacillota bacterium]|nr:MOSC domain-containing protein [Bacillota bacterium]
MMRIRSLNVGMPVQVPYNNHTILTAVEKKPTEEELFLSRVNFTGDAQGDLVHHGGPDKAVNVYSFDHYPYWEQELGITLDYAAFGENLTVEGWTESEVCIGDIYRLGNAIVQVSQPRKPCYKLELKHGIAGIEKKVIETGFSGFYLRVLEEGTVSQRSDITLIKKHPLGITVSFVNQLMYNQNAELAAIKQVICLEELSEVWRESLRKRIEAP